MRKRKIAVVVFALSLYFVGVVMGRASVEPAEPIIQFHHSVNKYPIQTENGFVHIRWQGNIVTVSIEDE